MAGDTIHSVMMCRWESRFGGGDNMFDFEHAVLQMPVGNPEGVSRWLEICVWISGEIFGPKTQI